MKKAIVYCRSATADADSEVRLLKQESDCLEYAKKHSYDVLEVISESGVSGLDPNRKGLQKLLSMCNENEIEAVITQDIYRLSRDLQHINSLMQTFVNTKIELVHDGSNKPTNIALVGLLTAPAGTVGVFRPTCTSYSIPVSFSGHSRVTSAFHP